MRILVADDETPARDRLCRMLRESHPDAELLQAENGEQALRLIMDQRPGVALLDIRMPLMDGLEVARLAGKLEDAPAVIFTTAWEQHALDAFDCHAVAYLLKPIAKAKLRQSLQRAAVLRHAVMESLRDSLPQARSCLSVSGGGKLTLLPLEQILYFRSEQRWVLAGMQEEEEKVVDETLKQLETEFADQFVRVHRNALAAVRHVTELRKVSAFAWEVSLRDSKTRLAVSRRLLSRVRARLKQR